MEHEPIAYIVKAPDGGEFLQWGKTTHPVMADCEYIPLYESNFARPEPFISFSQIEWMAALAAAGQQQPLSDDEIIKLFYPSAGTADSDWNAIVVSEHRDDFIAMARKIERAHGIGMKDAN